MSGWDPLDDPIWHILIGGVGSEPTESIWNRPIGREGSHEIEEPLPWVANEQRLAELRSMAYRVYLATPEWRYKRREMIKWAERKCQRCREFSHLLQVHHRCYDRLGEELVEDLEVLCDKCHRQEHGLPS